MNTKAYKKFENLMGLAPPTAKLRPQMEAISRNWALLHPALATMPATELSLAACRQYMHLELNREEGPRFHIMDRLYKRLSNLRREMETTAMLELLPEEEMVVEE